ncbi:MAG TPA: aminotransferase class IV [Candidatus Manganitrophaceae bacterium]|nr:aminotransferase class IV [Candidatus Manganitrophaceae bacterium]
MWIYLQDQFVPREKAKISVLDYGFLYGDGLFETFRAYEGRIFRLSEHLDRLGRAADRLALSPPSAEILENLLYETLRRNRLKEALLRLTLSRGEGAPGLNPAPCTVPTLVITARKFEGYPKDDYLNGVSGVIVQARRHAAALDPGLKSISFLSNILAKLEAKKKGAFEGIFLNTEGALCEGAVSNLFWIREGRLKTAAAPAGILEGITRRAVLELARRMKIETEEGFYPAGDLFAAEEAFLTSSGLELMPLTSVDGKKIGKGLPGRLTQRLHHAFREAVRER